MPICATQKEEKEDFRYLQISRRTGSTTQYLHKSNKVNQNATQNDKHEKFCEADYGASNEIKLAINKFTYVN